jgi:glycosyltransferase involved in cell wall biosynthesis
VPLVAAPLSLSQARREAASLLRLGVAFMASGLLMMGAAYAARIITLRELGLDAAGLYQSAWAIGGLYVGFVLQAMGADFYPRLVGVAADDVQCNRLVNEQAHVSLLLAAPGVLATVVLAPWILQVFYTSRFAGAQDVLRWICLGVALRVISWPMGFIIVARNNQWVFLATELAWTVVNVGATWLCVRRFGLAGAGIAFFVSYVFHVLMIYATVRRLSGFRWSPAVFRTGLGFIALAALVCLGLRVLPPAWGFAGGAVAVLASAAWSCHAMLRLLAPAALPRHARRLVELWRRLTAPTPVGESDIVRANGDAYEHLVAAAQTVDRRADPERALRAVAHAALFAARFHPGRFADGAIENVAFDIGLSSCADLPVVGVVHRVAGVSCTCCRRCPKSAGMCACCCTGSPATRRRSTRCSSSSRARVARPGNWSRRRVPAAARCISVPAGPACSRKAARLRQLARSSADLVVLHHDCCDVVPSVAFACDDVPPVVVLDHADHLFWLGSSVADTVIALRSVAAEHAASRRFAAAQAVLPIPLTDTSTGIARDEARRTLGVPDDCTMLLTVGRAIKYRPCGEHDFVATANRILERHPAARLYVVGETLQGIRPYLRRAPHERMHFVGVIGDPAVHRAAADIYVESFPFGSTTALLEAALSGLPVVPAYAPLFPLLVASDDSLSDLLPNPASEAAYIERVGQLIDAPQARAEFGATLRERLMKEHVGAAWLDRLQRVYRHTDGLVHHPRLLAASPCSLSPADLGLGRWNVMGDGVSTHCDADVGSRSAVLRHAASVAKDVGDYPRARRRALQAVLADWRCVASWRLLAIAVAGPSGRRLRHPE